MQTFTIIFGLIIMVLSIAAVIASIAIGSILGTILALAAFMPTAFAVHALATL